MRWLYKVFFLGGVVYLCTLIGNFGKQFDRESVQKPNRESEDELVLQDEVGYESEFTYLTELLEKQLQTEVRLVGGQRGKVLSIETDDDQVARVSFHKNRYIVVRLSRYHLGLQAWFTAAFMAYKVNFQVLRPVVTTKKGHNIPRGR